MAEPVKILLLERAGGTRLAHELEKIELEYTLKIVSTAKEYENALVSYCPDLILASDTLHSLKGPGALRIRQQKCPAVPFILVSRITDEEAAIELIKEGATDYVSKSKLHNLGPKILRALKEAREYEEKGQAELQLKESLQKLQQAEKQLLETNRKISNILESIGDAFFTVDFNWTVTYWNNAAEHMTGVKREDILGKNLWDIFDKDIYPISFANYNKALTERLTTHFEDFFVPLNSWTSISAYPSDEGISVYFKDITEKVLAEKALRQSEEKRRLIMDAALDAIICMDSVGYVTFWNSQAEKIFGWKSDEAVGQKLSQLIIPEQWREKHEKGLAKFRKRGFGGPILNSLVEMQAIDKRKKVFPVEMSIVPVQEAGDYFFCGFLRDITVRKKAERSLIESELSLKRAQALANVGSWEVDFVKNTTVWSDETYRIMGYAPGEVPATMENYYARIHPEDIEEVKSIIEKSGEDLQPRSFVHRIVRRDGDIRFVVSESEYVKSAENKALGIHGVFHDVTGEKLQEEMLERKNEELRHSEAKYRNMFQQSPLPMWVYDQQSYQFLDVNEAAIRHYGYSREEFLGMTIRDIRPVEDIPALERDVQKSQTNPTYTHGIFRHFKKNGDLIHVQIQSSSIVFLGKHARLILSIDISEKLKAEQALQQNEQRFRALVQEGSDLISILNADGIYQYVSPTSQRILGIDPESLVGKSAFGFIHPDDAEVALSQFQALQTQKRVKVDPFRFKNGMGEWRWIETTATNMSDDPVIAGIVANSRDITETYIIQQEITQVKEAYEAVANATSDAIYESDVQTGVVHITGQGYKHLFGYDLENCDVTTDFMASLIHPDDHDRIFSVYEEALRTPSKKLWSPEYRLKKADGTYVYVLNRFSVVFENGVPLKILGATHEIEARKQAELRLANSEKRFRALIENSSDGLTIISADKKVMDMSPSGKRILGYDREDYVGEDRSQLIHPHDRQRVDECFEAALKNPEDIRKIEYRFKKADGEYAWIESTFHNQLGNPYINAIVLNYRDITERKKQEEEREQLIKELTQNYQDLKQFSFITSHNLRAPLSNLLGILELIDDSKIEDEETGKLVELFRISTHQLNDTINDLVKILIIKQNPEIGKLTIDLSDTWEKVKNMVQGELEEVDPLIETSFDQAPQVYFNPAYLESIFLNLLTNALKYRSPERRMKLEINSRGERDYVVLTFADNGIGMNVKKYADRIFGLYQRFHAHAEGKGIGLYMVHSQVSALGGKIEIEGEEGRGLRLTIYLKKEKENEK